MGLGGVRERYPASLAFPKPLTSTFSWVALAHGSSLLRSPKGNMPSVWRSVELKNNTSMFLGSMLNGVAIGKTVFVIFLQSDQIIPLLDTHLGEIKMCV